MNTRPPRSTRTRILNRDNHTCVDCRHQQPQHPSTLEVDHDLELTDGGTHDDNNLVTRCIPHHEQKTEERRMARTTTSPVRARASTAVIGPQPVFPARAAAGLVAVVAGSTLAATGFGRPVDARAAAGLCAATVCALTGLWLRQVMWWHRNRNAQHLFAVLAGVVGVAPAARKHRFRVRAWAGTRPVDVAVRPPKGWVPGTQVDEIAAAYTAATGTRGFAVHRRGWIRVSPHRDLGGGQADITDPDESPTPDARSRVEDRVRDVLLPLVGGDGRVTITDWWDRTNPRALTFAYASAAARNARAARNELGVLLADVCPPRARNGRWAVQWDAAADRFHARDEPDPLSPVVVPAPMTSDLDLVAGPIIGVTEAGDPWRLPLLGSHVLVAGATGAGKGSVLWGLIRGVLPLIGDGRVKLWVIDPKGGMELGAMESIAYRFATADGAADLLAEAAEVMEDQAQRLRASGRRKLETPTQGFPLHLVVVDELAALTSLAPEPRVRNAMNATMGRLLTQGRAVGFTVVGALQDPRQKNLDNRNLFPVAVALRLKEPQMVDMVLGAGSRTAGALCDMIPRALPGVAYVVADGQAETMRVRAAFVSDDEVARMTTPPTPPPAHTPVVVGEQLALPDAVGVVGVNRVKPGDKVLLPGDPNQVTVVGVGPDPDEPDDRTEVVYRYDGEHVDRVASFDRDDAFRVAP